MTNPCTMTGVRKYFSFTFFLGMIGGCFVWGGILCAIAFALYSVAEWIIRLLTHDPLAVIALPEYAGPVAAVICMLAPGAFFATMTMGQLEELQAQSQGGQDLII